MGLRARLLRPTYALPLDAFRVVAGLLTAAYFLGQLLWSRDFYHADGFIDHALIARALWPLRLSLLPAGTPDAAMDAAMLLGCLCGVAVAAGWRARASAALGYLVAVSYVRRGFVVMEVDDMTIMLLLAWMTLMPVGRTLVLKDWLREGRACWPRWLNETVPGATAELLMANIAILYLVAGFSKLGSPWWRGGYGLYATLRLPFADWPYFWRPQHLRFLSILDYATLLIECSMAPLLYLPARSSLRRIGLLLQVGLHAGIIACFGLPFINLTVIASSLVCFRDDLMALLRGDPVRPSLDAAALGGSGRLALAMVASIALCGFWDTPLYPLSYPGYAALWAAGLFQEYHLFNWIDTKGFRNAFDVTLSAPGEPPRPLDQEELFPRSARSGLAQAYVINVEWVRLPEADRLRLRESILRRAASRLCRRPGREGEVSVRMSTEYLGPMNVALPPPNPKPLMRFRCEAGSARDVVVKPQYGSLLG